MKQTTFNYFIANTLSNSLLHFFLILIEYIFFIFPSCVDAVMKISHYDNSIEEYKSETVNITLIQISKYYHINNSIFVPIVIVCIVFAFLIIYGLISLIGTITNSKLKYINLFFVNIYDLVIFRYFSLVTLDSLLLLVIHYIQDGIASEKYLSIIFLILFLLFSLVNYYFIINTFVLMNITNCQLVNSPKKYPFDQLSKEYDIIMFGMKILVALESHYCDHNKKINIIMIAINIMIIALSILLFCWIFIIKTFFSWNFSILYTNHINFIIRKGVSIFNFIVIIFGLLFFHIDSTDMNIILICIFAFNITLIVLYFDSYYFQQSFMNNRSFSYSMILLMLINDSTKESSSQLQLKLIQNSSIKKHKIECKTGPLNCLLCKNILSSLDIQENTKVIYQYIKKNKQKQKHSFSEEMVKLFYYKINQKTNKLFRYYFYLIHKYSHINKSYVRNIKMIFELWLKKDQDNNSELTVHLLEVHSLGNEIKELLIRINNFFSLNFSIKRPETVIELSSDLSILTNKTKVNSEKNNSLSNIFTQLEFHCRSINGAINYNMIILRYIIESLTNQSLHSLFPLYIESLEDFLNHHYSMDQILICSINLASIYDQDIRIIKATGNCIDYDQKRYFLNDYFPKELQRYGIDLFIHQLNTAKETKTDIKTFIFPFTNKSLINYLKYSFYVSLIPDTSSLMIFGQLNRIKQKNLLLDISHEDIILLGYCKEFLKLLHLKEEWFGLLKEMNNALYLQSFFIILKKDENAKIIECQMDYDAFLRNMKINLKELISLNEFNVNPENKFILKTSIEKMKKYREDHVRITLNKIMEYNKGICLYNMKIHNQTKITSPINARNNHEDNKSDCEEQGYEILYNLQSTVNSASSVTKSQSVSSQTHSKPQSHSEYHMIDCKLKGKISTEAKKLSIFTFIMLGLNILLILICIIFLFTQISQTQQLSDLSQLYFQFKGIRWAAVSFFLSLACTICYSSTSKQTTLCVNPYGKYSEEFIIKYGIPKEYDLLKYSMIELQFKAEYAQETLNSFKKLLYSSSNIQFQSLLETPMKYFEFKEEFDSNELMELNITFEEGWRKYINSISILTKTTEHIAYDTIPIYFIRYTNKTYIFRDSTVKNLNLIQKEIYKGITNYMNFFYSFSQGDKSIKEDFDQLGNSNKIMNIIFMVLICSCNIILCILCKRNIDTAYYIFKVLIYNFVMQSEKKDYIITFQHKLDNLILLSDLYKKNPFHIIKKLNKTVISSQKKIIGRQSFISQTEENLPYQKDEYKTLKFGFKFYFYIVGKLIALLIGIFGLFFITIITFDIIILIRFSSVLNLFDYVLLNYNSDHTLLTNLAMTTLSHIVNTTNEDLASAMGVKNSEDGILNDLIKSNLRYYFNLQNYSTLNSSSYPTMESMVTYSCEELFFSFNETVLERVSNILMQDYRIVNGFICSAFNLLNVPNFYYLKSDISTRTQDLISKRSKRDYATLYKYATDKYLLDLYTILLLVFRPLSIHFKENILLPKITASFSSFVSFVGLYLGVNICLELLLFITVRWGISSKITMIQNNLYLLNNCVS